MDISCGKLDPQMTNGYRTYSRNLRKFMNEKGVEYLAISHSREVTGIYVKLGKSKYIDLIVKMTRNI